MSITALQRASMLSCKVLVFLAREYEPRFQHASLCSALPSQPCTRRAPAYDHARGPKAHWQSETSNDCLSRTPTRYCSVDTRRLALRGLPSEMMRCSESSVGGSRSHGVSGGGQQTAVSCVFKVGSQLELEGVSSSASDNATRSTAGSQCKQRTCCIVHVYESYIVSDLQSGRTGKACNLR